MRKFEFSNPNSLAALASAPLLPYNVLIPQIALDRWNGFGGLTARA
jgi:hypothetical protein